MIDKFLTAGDYRTSVGLKDCFGVEGNVRVGARLRSRAGGLADLFQPVAVAVKLQRVRTRVCNGEMKGKLGGFERVKLLLSSAVLQAWRQRSGWNRRLFGYVPTGTAAKQYQGKGEQQ